MKSLQDSIETGVAIKLFKNIKISTDFRLNYYSLEKIKMSAFKNVINFNSNRLQKTASLAYPVDNRPRGSVDIKSVNYHVSLIESGIAVPIWLAKKNNDYILLDGAHRIVAHYIKNKKTILAYVINIDKD